MCKKHHCDSLLEFLFPLVELRSSGLQINTSSFPAFWYKACELFRIILFPTAAEGAEATSCP